ACHVGQHGGVPGDDDADFAGLDRTLAGFHAGHLAAIADNAGDLAVLDDVDAGGVGGAGLTPGHAVMAGAAAARLQRRPQHRIADVGRDVDDRHFALDLFRRDEAAVDAVQAVGVGAAMRITHVL